VTLDKEVPPSGFLFSGKLFPDPPVVRGIVEPAAGTYSMPEIGGRGIMTHVGIFVIYFTFVRIKRIISCHQRDVTNGIPGTVPGKKSLVLLDLRFLMQIRIFFYIQGLKRHKYRLGPGKIYGKHQGF
jgi:hypothetical protein